MQKQRFDPTEGTVQEFIEFIEECCEPFDTKKKEIVSKATSTSGKKKRERKTKEPSRSNKSQKTGKKYCMMHGQCNHTTAQCKILQKLVDDNKPKDGGYKHPSRNGKDGKNRHQNVFVIDGEEDEAFLNRMKDDMKTSVTNHCNKLFKAFKRKLEEDNYMTIESGPKKVSRDENAAYNKLIKLNTDTLEDDSSGEDTA